MPRESAPHLFQTDINAVDDDAADRAPVSIGLCAFGPRGTSMREFGERLAFREASQVVAMDEKPQDAVRKKKDSSLRVAIDLVKSAEADACVSAGNTGALMGTAKFVLKTLPGIDRPAICAVLPTHTGKVYALDLVPREMLHHVAREDDVDRPVGQERDVAHRAGVELRALTAAVGDRGVGIHRPGFTLGEQKGHLTAGHGLAALGQDADDHRVGQGLAHRAGLTVAPHLREIQPGSGGVG